MRFHNFLLFIRDCNVEISVPTADSRNYDLTDISAKEWHEDGRVTVKTCGLLRINMVH